MGCFWSCGGGAGAQERCHSCYRRAVNNLVVLNNQCEICRDKANRHRESIVLRPLFGEYRCSKCGRKWSSRRSWQGHCQLCKRCKIRVYPQNVRELRSTDMSRDRKNVPDHPQELCEKCIKLGYNCGKTGK